MPRQLLIEYLDKQHATYSCQSHEVAYTAPEIAERSHIAGHQFAKVVMIIVEQELAMIVLPAHYQVDVDALRVELGVGHVVLASEREFSHRFPRCEIGAMPPFGHLFGLQTFMVPVFDENSEIAFNAGTHSELIRMPFNEYLRLAYVSELADGVVPPGKDKDIPSE